MEAASALLLAVGVKIGKNDSVLFAGKHNYCSCHCCVVAAYKTIVATSATVIELQYKTPQYQEGRGKRVQ